MRALITRSAAEGTGAMLSDTNDVTRGWINRNLVRHLAPAFARHDFKRHKIEWSWGWEWGLRRVAGDVTQRVGFVTTPRDATFMWSLLFHYCSEPTEAMFDRFVPPDRPEARHLGSTCRFNLQSLIPWDGRKEVPLNARALQESVAGVIPALNKVVLPFLDAGRDHGGLNDLMNGTHKDLCIRGNRAHFTMRAIIVARLAGAPGWGRLVARLRRGLGAGDESLETYDRLAEHLRTHAS